jgi:hypothetical protein
MNRVAEPELMTGDEQVEAYALADLSALHDPLVAAVRDAGLHSREVFLRGVSEENPELQKSLEVK